MAIDIFAPNRRGVSVVDRIDASGDCWEWTGNIKDNGYGYFSLGGRKQVVHRVVWESLVGPIPEGLDLDHLCRNRSCVNPDHCQPVTRAENLRRGAGNGRLRKDRCPRGHLYSDNPFTQHLKNGKSYRLCRTCRDARSAKWREERKVTASCL